MADKDLLQNQIDTRLFPMQELLAKFEAENSSNSEIEEPINYEAKPEKFLQNTKEVASAIDQILPQGDFPPEHRALVAGAQKSVQELIAFLRKTLIVLVPKLPHRIS